MKIAILGGTRFVGKEILRLLQHSGHDVVILSRGIHPLVNSHGVHHLLVDRNNFKQLRDALTLCRPDVLIDTFSMTTTDAKTVGAAASGVCGRLVILSSQDVYAQFGRMNGLPCENIEALVSEGSPLTIPYPFRGLVNHAGGNEYDKKDVERAFLELSNFFTSITILRLPAVYGRGDYQLRFKEVIIALNDGAKEFPVCSGGLWRWTHGHVTDISHACLLTCEKSPTGYRIFNVGEKDVQTMRERVASFARLMSCEVSFIEKTNLPERFSLLGKAPNDFIADTSAIRSELGFSEPNSLDDNYRDVIEWVLQTQQHA